MSLRVVRPRHIVFALVPVLVAFVDMLANDNVDAIYSFQRVQPFAFMAMAKLLMVAVLIVQHPDPPCGTPRWKLHRWVDPIVLMLAGTTLPSILYFVLLVGGNSGQFQAPGWGYDLARAGMWLFGFIGTIVWMEMIYRGIQSRRENRTRWMARYDVDVEKEEES